MLIERISRAFESAAPVEMDVAADGSQEAFDYTSLLVGKCWKDIDVLSQPHLAECLAWISPENGARLIPAYLLALVTSSQDVRSKAVLEQNEDLSRVFEQTLQRLTPHSASVWSPSGYQSFFWLSISRRADLYFERFAASLMPLQRQVIAESLAWLAEVYEQAQKPNDPLVESPIRFALDRFWKVFVSE